MRGSDIIKFSHQRLVFNRRTSVLAAWLAPLFPRNASILDIGCGDGTIDQELLKRRPDVSIVGIDLFARPSSRISITVFDGKHIPYGDGSFDVATFIDVLHHTQHPEVLLRQAKRVAKKAIVIKDHFRDGFLADATLRLMDWVGNAAHGVALPYNFWSHEEWETAFRSLSLEPDKIVCPLRLYPMPASLIFDRDLHFIARLPIEPRKDLTATRAWAGRARRGLTRTRQRNNH
jgi:SAM-dependent methyltransferase